MVKKPAYTELKERIKELEKKNTELKQVEEALKTAKEFAENLLETANTIVVTLDNAGLALYGLSPMSPARGNIREIEKASKRAAELSKQMLAYSGKRPGRLHPETLQYGRAARETHRGVAGGRGRIK